MRSHFLVTGLFGLVAFSPLFAAAQIAPSLAVNPEKFELSLSRGEVLEEILRITNTGADTLPVHLRAVRWEARDEVGGINFVDAPEDSSFDVVQWMRLGENDFILEPKESKRISVTITVPANAEPGGKYGAVFIEPTLPGFYFMEGAARVLPQIGVLFLIDLPVVGLEGQPFPAVAVEQFEIEGRSRMLSGVASRIASLFRAPLSVFAAEPPVSVSVLSRTASSLVLRVRNDGITHVRPSGTVAVHNLFGREVVRADLSPTTILPKKIRQFPVALANDDSFLPETIREQLAFGRYTAVVVLEGVGDEALLETLSYWIFPWQLLLALFVLVAPIAFLAYRFRARFLAALRTLLHGRPAP